MGIVDGEQLREQYSGWCRLLGSDAELRKAAGQGPAASCTRECTVFTHERKTSSAKSASVLGGEQSCFNLNVT
jgi:hypothetical protein